jgi:hypothetical protein
LQSLNYGRSLQASMTAVEGHLATRYPRNIPGSEITK